MHDFKHFLSFTHSFLQKEKPQIITSETIFISYLKAFLYPALIASSSV